MGNRSAFSRLGDHIKNLNKRWYKRYINRANRKKVRQARDIAEHQDKPLDARALD